MPGNPLTSSVPDFLLKSTQGVAIASALFVFPFSMLNFLQNNYFLGMLGFMVTAIFTVNAWLCHRGEYNKPIMLVNQFGMAPFMTVVVIIALYKLGPAGSYWAFGVLLTFYFILPERMAWITNLVFLVIVIPIAWKTLQLAEAIRFAAVLCLVSLYAAIFIRQITKQYEMLQGQAATDTLTGLYNRSLLQTSLEQAINQSQRIGIDVSMIMLDIDHFKMINDELGHDAGDRVLGALGKFLKEFFRSSDMAFRIGGEEFLILAYNSSQSKTVELAEKLRQEISHLPLYEDKQVTVSIGVAALEKWMNWEEWMKRCDENLYRAKSGGRNRVVG